MEFRRLLEMPAIYDLKTAAASMGRNSVGRYLERAARVPAGGLVLDVACGTGRHARVFGGCYCGVDENVRYICYAARRRCGMFGAMNALNMGFPDSCFSLVFSVGLLHHLPDEQAVAAVREMCRVAGHDGKVLIIEGVLARGMNLLGAGLFRLDRGGYVRSVEALGNLLAPEGFHMETENLPGSFPYRRAVFSNR